MVIKGFGISSEKLVDLPKAGAENVLHREIIISSTLKTLPDFRNPSVLHQKYVSGGLSLKQIAQDLSCAKTTILDNLKKLNIPLRERGRPRAASLPFGKRRVGRTIMVHQFEARTIETIKKMYIEEKLSLRAIARILSDMKIPTKRQGKAWHHEMIRNILKRERII